MASAAAKKWVYPATPRLLNSSYVKHGVTIAEPYSYLEDTQHEDTTKFVDQQNDLFSSYIKQFPKHKELRDTLGKLMDYPRTGAPSSRKDNFYYFHNTGLQNQSVMYQAKSLDDKEAKVFLDPNTLSEDGTASLKSTAWSDNQRYFAYGVSRKGSDWFKIYIMDSETMTTREDEVLEWVKFSGMSWVKNDGFFYTRYPELKEGVDIGAETDLAVDCMVYYHKLGTSQKEDTHVMAMPDNNKWMLGAEVSDDDQYVMLSVHDGCEPKNLVQVAKLEADGDNLVPKTFKWEKVVAEWTAEYGYLGNDGSLFYFETTEGAPKKKIVSYDLQTKQWADVVKERQDAPLEFVALVKDTLLLGYLQDAKHVLSARKLKDLEAEPTKIDIPIGSIVGLSARRKCDFVSVKVTSFLLPGRSYTFDINDVSKLTVWRDDTLSSSFDPDAFETKQIFYESGSGESGKEEPKVKIPMFIIHRKGIELTGQNPTLLYGYGGFSISLTPSFSSNRIAFLNNLGGVLAIANIRGGGEYGKEWHSGGKLNQKQNCFTDFINGAKYLHAQKYSTPEKLCIMGGSNGGLLVAAVANQAPHLIGSVVAQVGVMDVLKFHTFTIGHGWTSDFGNPDKEEDFHVALKYSPIHNVKTSTSYPKVLCLTGDHDDRVVPLHTLKYLAAMQHANPDQGGPVLGRIEKSAGHGAGKPTAKVLDEAADTYGFIALSLGATWKD